VTTEEHLSEESPGEAACRRAFSIAGFGGTFTLHLHKIYYQRQAGKPKRSCLEHPTAL